MLRKKTPIGKLEEQPNVHPAQEKDPLPAHPGGVNPETGEVGGPRWVQRCCRLDVQKVVLNIIFTP